MTSRVSSVIPMASKVMISSIWNRGDRCYQAGIGVGRRGLGLQRCYQAFPAKLPAGGCLQYLSCCRHSSHPSWVHCCKVLIPGPQDTCSHSQTALPPKGAHSGALLSPQSSPLVVFLPHAQGP